MGLFGSIFSCALCLAVIGVSIWLSIYYLGDRDSLPEQLPDLPEDLGNYLPLLELFNREDPFSNVNPSDANRWPNDGSGLDLLLINSLDSVWYEFFDLAVQEWDNGSPDSLTLKTEMGTPNPECPSVDGAMNVCNGDYGETDWKGINTILMSSGWITTSSAKMNDHFFVSDSDSDKRQYTMCHEIGHGFGLPHTDEEFWNRDLGNCLDYTNNFSGNKSPDTFLYNLLTDLYGSVDGSRAPNVTVPVTDDAIPDDGSTANQSTGNRRRMMRNTSRSGNDAKRTQQRQLFSAVKDEERRRKLLQKWDEINKSVNNGFHQSERARWRLLHKTPYGEAHEIDLDDEYTVQIHTLYA